MSAPVPLPIAWKTRAQGPASAAPASPAPGGPAIVSSRSASLSASVGGEKQLIVRCALGDFGRLQSALEERNIEPVSTASEFVPQTTVELDDAQAEEALKLVDLLEQDDDVQQVFHNLA